MQCVDENPSYGCVSVQRLRNGGRFEQVDEGAFTKELKRLLKDTVSTAHVLFHSNYNTWPPNLFTFTVTCIPHSSQLRRQR